MFDFCNITRALSDENRVRVLMALRHGPLCVCQITALLDLAPSTTSKHLSILRQCRLIESVKQGRWVYYQLPEQPVSASVSTTLDWARTALANDATVQADDARLDSLRHLVDGAEGEGDSQHCHSPALHLLDEENTK